MPARRRETLVVAALLAVLAVAAFGAHLRPGGFYNDDWVVPQHRASTPPRTRSLGAVRAFDWLSFRPLQMLYWPFAFRVLGTDPERPCGLAPRRSGSSWPTLVFVLLRALRVPAVHAGLMAGLALLLPVADSTRFWPAQGANQLAVACYLAGLILALRSLRAGGSRRASSHLPAVGLYAASILLYEIAASLIVATGLLYVVVAGRRGLRPWAIDVGVAVTLLAFVTSGTFYEPLSLDEQIEHARRIARQAPYVFARTFWAPATPTPAARVAVLVVAAAILSAGWWVARRPHGDPAYRPALRSWLGLAAGAVVAAGVAYLMIVPSALLDPRSPGEGNRANMLAGLALVVLAYAVIAVAALLAVRRVTAWKPLATAATVLAALLIAAGAAASGPRRPARVGDRRPRAAAHRRRCPAHDAAAGARDDVPHVPSPGAAAPGVPVFQAVWDLAGAIQLRYDDLTLRAYPVPPGSTVDCGPRSLTVHNYNDAFERQSAAYGAVRVVDVAAARAFGVATRSQCQALTGRLLAAG